MIRLIPQNPETTDSTCTRYGKELLFVYKSETPEGLITSFYTIQLPSLMQELLSELNEA